MFFQLHHGKVPLDEDLRVCILISEKNVTFVSVWGLRRVLVMKNIFKMSSVITAV